MIHELAELLDVGLQVIVGQLRKPAAVPAPREIQANDPQCRRRVQGQKVEALGNVGQPADGDHGLSVSSGIGVREPHWIGLPDAGVGVLETHGVLVGEAAHRRAAADAGGKRLDQGFIVAPVHVFRLGRPAHYVPLAQSHVGPVRRGQHGAQQTGRRSHSEVRWISVMRL